MSEDELDEDLIPFLLDGEENGMPPPRTRDQLLVYLTRLVVSMKKTVSTLADEVTTLHQIVERLDTVTASGTHDLKAIKAKAKKLEARQSEWKTWAVRTGVVLMASGIGALFMWWLQRR